jgi:TPR repeat protein
MRLAYSRFIVCICVLLAAGCGTISPEERVASFDEGVRLYDAGQYEEAYKIFDGLSYVDAAAARNAALMLRKGQGVEKNPAEAKRLFEFAAQAGLATAAADLGEMLLLGEGGSPDPGQALPWLQMASTAHHAIAEYHLGMMYETGNGVDKDLGMAKKLYADSAASGMEESAARLKALGGEPPPLRSTTEDTSGPSRESGVPAGSQPPDATESSPAPEAKPEPAPAADDKPKSADDYQDISTPDFQTPDESPDAVGVPDMEPPDGVPDTSPPSP